MQTDDIDIVTRRLLTRTQSRLVNFLGVFALDEQPSTDDLSELKKYPVAYIINSDPSNKPGQHWLAVYKESQDGALEFFDSYGQHPSNYSFPRTASGDHSGRCGSNNVNCNSYSVRPSH